MNIKKIQHIIVAALNVLYTFIFLFTLLITLNTVIAMAGSRQASVLGYMVSEIRSGSMEASGFTAGDFVITKRVADAGELKAADAETGEAGDIITFYVHSNRKPVLAGEDRGGSSTVFHEIMGVNAEGYFITKGSSNTSADPYAIPFESVAGKYIQAGAFGSFLINAILAENRFIFWIIALLTLVAVRLLFVFGRSAANARLALQVEGGKRKLLDKVCFDRNLFEYFSAGGKKRLIAGAPQGMGVLYEYLLSGRIEGSDPGLSEKLKGKRVGTGDALCLTYSFEKGSALNTDKYINSLPQKNKRFEKYRNTAEFKKEAEKDKRTALSLLTGSMLFAAVFFSIAAASGYFAAAVWYEILFAVAALVLTGLYYLMVIWENIRIKRKLDKYLAVSVLLPERYEFLLRPDMFDEGQIREMSGAIEWHLAYNVAGAAGVNAQQYAAPPWSAPPAEEPQLAWQGYAAWQGGSAAGYVQPDHYAYKEPLGGSGNTPDDRYDRREGAPPQSEIAGEPPPPDPPERGPVRSADTPLQREIDENILPDMPEEPEIRQQTRQARGGSPQAGEPATRPSIQRVELRKGFPQAGEGVPPDEYFDDDDILDEEDYESTDDEAWADSITDADYAGGGDAVNTSARAPRRQYITLETRLRMTTGECKSRFSELLNEILKYKGVTGKLTSNYLTVKRGSAPLLRMTVMSKTIKLYFHLDPAAFDKKYRVQDYSKNKIFKDYSALIRVRSDRSFSYALELVNYLAHFNNLKPNPNYMRLDYALDFPYVNPFAPNAQLPEGGAAAKHYKEQFVLSEYKDALKNGDMAAAVILKNDDGTGAGEHSQYEAVCQWSHPVFGTIAPEDFMPVFCEYGISDKIDFLTISKAAQIADEMEFDDGKITVAIAPDTAASPDFISRLLELLTDMDVDKSCLKFEINKHLPQIGLGNIDAVIKDLRSMGFNVNN